MHIARLISHVASPNELYHTQARLLLSGPLRLLTAATLYVQTGHCRAITPVTVIGSGFIRWCSQKDMWLMDEWWWTHWEEFGHLSAYRKDRKGKIKLDIMIQMEHFYIKGIIHSHIKNFIIIYSLSCCSNAAFSFNKWQTKFFWKMCLWLHFCQMLHCFLHILQLFQFEISSKWC